MRPVAHLANLDLNLLVALRELVRERSVTRAAQRLGVTQPAASASLSRLRRPFGDELSSRARRPVLSALGESWRSRSRRFARRGAAARGLFRVVQQTSDREFALVMADYRSCMGEALSQAVQRAAPRARLHIRLVRESLATGYSDGIRFVDDMVAPPSNGFALPDTRSAELFGDRWLRDRRRQSRARRRQRAARARPWGLPGSRPYPARWPRTRDAPAPCSSSSPGRRSGWRATSRCPTSSRAPTRSR